MNTAMQEVWDLGWKLQGVLEGWAGPKMLESYEIERRPIAARNLKFSTGNFNAWRDVPETSAICDETVEGARQRTEMGERLRASTRVEWESLGLQIGHRYENSPICVADGSAPTPDEYSRYIPTSRPGSRAPHAWLPDGRSMLDLFGEGFVLLDFGNGDGADKLAAAFGAKGVPFRVERIADADISRLYERPLVLVRPDGHVAWRGDRVGDATTIVDVARGVAA